MQPDIEGRILRLTFEVRFGTSDRTDLIGHGEVAPVSLMGTDEYAVPATVTCPREALALLVDPPPGRVNLVLRFTGLLQYRRRSDNGSGNERTGDSDEWQTMLVGGDNVIQQLELSFARSDWFEQVVQPLKLGGYLITSLRLPDAERVPSWKQALAHLGEAQRALTSGTPPAVFGRCRAAIEALPGDKTQIFDAMPEGKKRTEIDALTKAVGKYMHSGRHVVPGTQGMEAGEFPVDQRDAAFIYNLTNLLLSHIASLVLEA